MIESANSRSTANQSKSEAPPSKQSEGAHIHHMRICSHLPFLYTFPSATKAASSPRGSPDKAAQGDASSSLPDFEDIADSAAELADTVSSLGSMFSEAFMLDTGASNSAKQQLTEKLGRFYMQHNPQKMQAPDAEKWLASVVDFYANKPGELNEQLKKQYGVGLDSMGSGAAPPPPTSSKAMYI